MAVAGYVRVSTTKQDTDNQKHEIEKWCKNNDISCDRFVNETVSSRKSDREIFPLAESLKEGDTLIVSELSRIGRSLIEILKIMNMLSSKRIRVVIIKENIDMRDDNPMGMFTIHIIGAFAELERGMISKRTKSAIEAKKSAGIHVGRTKGSKNKNRKLDGKEGKIREYLDKGMKKTEIALMLEVHRDTLYEKLEEMGVKSDV